MGVGVGLWDPCAPAVPPGLAASLRHVCPGGPPSSLLPPLPGCLQRPERGNGVDRLSQESRHFLRREGACAGSPPSSVWVEDPGSVRLFPSLTVVFLLESAHILLCSSDGLCECSSKNMALVRVHDLPRHFFDEHLSWAGQRVQCWSDRSGQGRVSPVLPLRT